MTRTQPIELQESSDMHVPPPPSAQEYMASSSYRDKVPIVIDNGTSELRAGFATDVQSSSADPSMYFAPLVSRYKDRKRSANILLVGPHVNMDTESKSKARPPTEGGLIVAQDVLENVLDFTFSRLGISTESNIEHPVVMSEPMCNPGYCRGLTSELLFEAYGAPSVTYGLDSLFAAYANGVQNDGLVIGSGHSSTTIVPMVGGRGILSNAKRLNWGGSSSSDHLLRLLQLKYPAFPVRLTSSQTNSLLESPGLFYTHPGGPEGDYASHVRSLGDLNRLQGEGKTIQIPFSLPEGSRRKELTDEDRQRREDRKKEATRRLQEMAQKTRMQKMIEKESQMKLFADLKSWKNKERRSDWLKRLESAGFDTEEDLTKAEKRVQSALKRSRKRDDGGEDDQIEPEDIPTFPLVEVPDHELDEESIKEKRRQRLMKAGYDARMRARAEKLEEKRQEAERRRLDEEERQNDPKGWCAKRRKEYEDTIQRMADRKRKRELLADRKSLAAQQRMKSITSLASDSAGGARGTDGAGAGAGGRAKRKRGGGGGGGGEGGDDTFGADDEDWAIYRDIQGAEDSEDEEEDEDTLVALESKLLQYDASFTRSDTLAARQARKRALTRTFLGGSPEGEDAVPGKKKGASADGDEDEEDVSEESQLDSLAKAHQITLNVERARQAEIFFQPSMAGVDQAGLDEISEMVVRGFDDEELRKRMVSNVFLTGQHSLYTNLDERLRNSLISLLPSSWRDTVHVRRAKDARFDAWRGMARWCLDERKGERYGEAAISRAEYEEMGQEYIKEHRFVSALI